MNLDDKLKTILVEQVANPNYDNHSTLVGYAVDEIKQAFTDARYMTGAEWLDRFASEISITRFAQAYEDRERMFTQSDVIDAAQRAAGIPQAPANTSEDENL